MSKQIVAHFRATTGARGHVFQAHDLVFIQDDAGKWRMRYSAEGNGDAVLESDVIADCRKATNWATIKAEHFAMADWDRGGEIIDRTPAYKGD